MIIFRFLKYGTLWGSYGLLTIPANVASIGAYAFYKSGLMSLTIPSKVASIDMGAFTGCQNLTSISVDRENPRYESIIGVLFDKVNKSIVQYPAGKSNHSFTVPSSVTSVCDGAFQGCHHLASVIFPDGVITIGMSAFEECKGLTSILQVLHQLEILHLPAVII